MLKKMIHRFWAKLPDKEPRPLPQQLKISDYFGRRLQEFNQGLIEPEASVAQAMLPHLIRMGCRTHPPREAKSFLNPSLPLVTHSHELPLLSTQWWRLVETCVGQNNLNRQLQNQCLISKANLPAARGIIWFHIHLFGPATVPGMLQFMTHCLSPPPRCQDMSVELAKSVANMLITQDYFHSWEREIHYYYPHLLEGQIGRKLQRSWARK
ncbi:MAG: hypothetical protein DA408_14735 [Bacteroidetes bacterium]|nr:MAG: hypothetical protein C7N36_16575 [Bacteroidota bacterium]PTM10958.1 MAG: hypothetical protein DA408_14735 [Bacteroidota bacterium]